MIVYKITNKVNDKSYVGFTSQLLKQRINQHKSKSKKEKVVNQINFMLP